MMNIEPTGVSPSNELMSLCSIDAIHTDQLSPKSRIALCGCKKNKRNGVNSPSPALLLRQGSVRQNDLFSGFTKSPGSTKTQLLPHFSMIPGDGIAK